MVSGVNRGVHRLLIVIALLFGLAAAYPAADAVWSAEQWAAEQQTAWAREEAARWEKRAKMWEPDDESRHARESRAEAKRLRAAVEAVEPADWRRAVATGSATFAGVSAGTYLGGMALWLIGRWVWRGFQYQPNEPS